MADEDLPSGARSMSLLRLLLVTALLGGALGGVVGAVIGYSITPPDALFRDLDILAVAVIGAAAGVATGLLLASAVSLLTRHPPRR
jgi:hypothetical protein